MRIRDAATGTEQLHLNHSGNVSDVKFNHDGTVLASVSHDGDVRIFDARTGAELSRIHHQVAKDEWLNAVAFSPEGSLLASAGDDGACTALASRSRPGGTGPATGRPPADTGGMATLFR